MSGRFTKKWDAAAPGLRGLIRQEVHSLKARRTAQVNWVGQYDQIKMYGSERVLEIDLGGGWRMIAHVGAHGALTLLDFGPHGFFAQYTRRMLDHDLVHASPLVADFASAAPSVQTTRTLATLTRYGNEVSRDWVYFLDEVQTRATEEIVTEIEDALAGDSRSATFVIGGPGTGKTSVLLQLLMRLSNAVVTNRETWDVRLDIGDRLASFIKASTDWDLGAVRRLPTASDPADVLLVDDPRDVAHVKRCATLLRSGAVRAVVIGFDPLQLQDSLEDKEYQALSTSMRATEHRLSTCYRQKAAVGESAVQVARAVAESSPFLIAERKRAYKRERRRLTAIANEVSFVNPTGHVVIEPHADASAFRRHVTWINNQALWTHWAPVLLVLDTGVDLPATWKSALRDVRHDVVPLAKATDMKGLEYQHVIMVLGPDRFQALQSGFSGSGRAVYNDYRLARIPYSRAKDSIATFVLAS